MSTRLTGTCPKCCYSFSVKPDGKSQERTCPACHFRASVEVLIHGIRCPKPREMGRLICVDWRAEERPQGERCLDCVIDCPKMTAIIEAPLKRKKGAGAERPEKADAGESRGIEQDGCNHEGT